MELLGLEPWVAGRVDLPTDTVLGTELYVPQLKPYTSYLLKVYSKNVGNLTNKDLHLEIRVGLTTFVIFKSGFLQIFYLSAHRET